jgi:hypothetical protein
MKFLKKKYNKNTLFSLLKRNDPEQYPYYTIRAQDNNKLKIQKLNFPNLEVLLDFECNSFSKPLYDQIKESLKAKNAIFKGNNIDLKDSEVTEEELIKAMMSINEPRTICTLL